jgi:DNA-binding protein
MPVKVNRFMMSEQNIVYVGSKNPMNYVMAVMQAINQNDDNEVVLKARGRAISTAVDVAEITRNRFLTELSEPVVEISTEELPGLNGATRNVSSMSIYLKQ